jgi:alcohol dehydrogenase
MITHFNPFSIARLPRIEFGRGGVSKLAGIAAGYGRRVLLVTGARSFDDAHWSAGLLASLDQAGLQLERLRIEGEPSPAIVNRAVSEFAGDRIDVVLGVGGGSALDAAKAIAGLLRVKRPVEDFLEGVGPELTYPGPAVPFIAAPTTAGTGSEATKNAVLSLQGTGGYKKSFRDDALVAEVAVVDPDLLRSCPPAVIAANGMDALTQLIESYVSIRANVFNDALGISGLRAARDGLMDLYRSEGGDGEARERMAYASLISGINLAQTGLGSVHGLASPLGAFYPIPHGVVCGTLVGAATEINIRALHERAPDHPALDRYARISEVLHERRFPSREEALQGLVDLLNAWTQRLQLERLSAYGIKASGLDHVVAHSRGSSMKTNPIVLTDYEIKTILEQRL